MTQHHYWKDTIVDWTTLFHMKKTAKPYLQKKNKDANSVPACFNFCFPITISSQGILSLLLQPANIYGITSINLNACDLTKHKQY